MNGKQNKKGNEIEGFNPKEMISNLTHCPGVYLMSNSKGEVIYVGKGEFYFLEVNHFQYYCFCTHIINGIMIL